MQKHKDEESSYIGRSPTLVFSLSELVRKNMLKRLTALIGVLFICTHLHTCTKYFTVSVLLKNCGNH